MNFIKKKKLFRWFWSRTIFEWNVVVWLNILASATHREYLSAWNEISFVQNKLETEAVGIAYIFSPSVFSEEIVIKPSNSKVLTKFFHTNSFHRYFCTHKNQQQRNKNICTYNRTPHVRLFAHNHCEWWHWIIFLWHSCILIDALIEEY